MYKCRNLTAVLCTLKGKYNYGFGIYFLFFKRFYLSISRQRGREGEREGKKHRCVVASYTPPTGDLAHNPGMSPDWESNPCTLVLQSGAQSTELHQPGLFSSIETGNSLIMPKYIIQLLILVSPVEHYMQKVGELINYSVVDPFFLLSVSLSKECFKNWN